MSANHAPSPVSRNVPSYYSPGDDSMAPGNRGSLSPRYSPTLHHQPWRRQHSHSSLSFVPSSSRPEQSEYTTAQSKRPAERGPVYISPFRSVRRMKEPFQLVLPSSPSIDSSPSLGSQTRTSRPPSGTSTLRTWRSDGNLMVTSLETFGLLPSPPLSDTPTSHPSPCPSSAYFSPKPQSESEKTEATTKSCDCETGTSVCDSCGDSNSESEEREQEQEKPTDITKVHLAHSTLVKQCEPEEPKSPPVQNDTPIMESPVIPPMLDARTKRNVSGSHSPSHRGRSATVSSETSWVPNNLSYCEEWLQGVPMEKMGVKTEVNRRRIQIVQKSEPPPGQSPGKHEANVTSTPRSNPGSPRSVQQKIKPPPHTYVKRPDEPVTLDIAERTRITKPKLVDISRQSSPAISYSLPIPHHKVPSTPDQRQQEVSAFSPETPLNMADSGYMTQHTFDSPSDSRDDKIDDGSTDSGSLSIESVGSTIVGDKSVSTPDLTPCSPPKSNSTQSRLSPISKPQASPGRSSNLSEKEELQKWWDHEWTIDQLEHSVKDFPRNMLKLTCPVIILLRTIDDRVLIRSFRKIFPNAPENLLDGLCATLIARNFIVALSAANRTTTNFSHKPTLSRLDPVPEKASSTFGMQFVQPTSTQIKDRVLGTRSIQLRKDLDRVIDKLLFTICGKSDEHLKSAVLVLVHVLENKA